MDKSITTAVDQTLTCLIGELTVTPEKQPVSVRWKDPEGNIILSTNENYVTSPGTLDSSGTQSALLTIKPEQSRKLATSSIYQCSVKSRQYPDSPDTEFIDLKVTVKKSIGKYFSFPFTQKN